jgi:hypothetical protein
MVGVALATAIAAIDRLAEGVLPVPPTLSSSCSLATVAAMALVLLVVSGCSVAPTQELSEARRALQAAGAAGAGDIASKDLSELRERVDAAARSLAAGDYSNARSFALAAKDSALKLRALSLVMEAAAAAVARREPGSVAALESTATLARAKSALRRGDHDRALAIARQLADGP